MASAGKPGLVALLNNFQKKIATAMALVGVTRIEDITRELIEQ